MHEETPPNVLHVTDAALAEELRTRPGLVLVDFYADWCGPCKVLEPQLNRILAQHPEVTLLKVNVDESPMSAGAYQILSIPTVLAFKGGAQVAEPILGAQKPAVYDAVIQQFGANASS